MFKTIPISLAPNSTTSDVLIALKYIFLPWYWFKWRRGECIQKLENKFKEYFNINFAHSFSSGRSCLSIILKTLGVGEGDEVIIQGYTCVVVPNAIIWNSAKPIYIDIDASLNIDPQKLEKKITSKTKAIIIQHTFGNPAQIDKIIDISRKHNLYIIEDCAHSLGAEYENRKIGTFGDIAFFSFGRDKVISSVAGGMIITNNEIWSKKIKEIQETSPFPSKLTTFQNLFHLLAFTIILPLYNFFYLGKILLIVLQKTRLLNKVYAPEEKKYQMPSSFISKLPNCLAQIALNQFSQLESFNQHRIRLAQKYSQNLKDLGLEFPRINENSKPIYLRFTIFSSEARDIINFARKKGVEFGDWYDHAVAPKWVDLAKVQYINGSCPAAENFAAKSFNLPTNIKIKKKDTDYIIKLLKDYFKK